MHSHTSEQDGGGMSHDMDQTPQMDAHRLFGLVAHNTPTLITTHRYMHDLIDTM